MFEFIDERLRVAYCYFATLPSQRADIKQQSSSNAQPPQKPLMTDDDHANGWWSGGDLAHDDVTRHEAALSDQECHKTNELQESVPEPVQASDYEFTESVLADKKVRCFGVLQQHYISVLYLGHSLVHCGNTIHSA